jgi:RNA polymerase primary sigma factor
MKEPVTTDQAELAVLAQKGDEAARTALVTMNEKFVYMVARQYMGQGLELADMVQEGNIGLLKAITLYDPKTGNKFLTYASWWIKQAILQALGEYNRQVRLPVNRINVLERYRKIKAALTQELQREPSQAEILQALGIESYELYDQHSTSYNTPYGGDSGEGTMLDLLPDETTDAPNDALLEQGFAEELEMILQQLNKRECTIIKMSYGIGYERAYTLEEIGTKLKLTRERIRQLKEKALKQLRRMDRRKKLEGLKD